MKNARPLMVILISVVVGAIAIAIAAQWVSTQANIATTKVVVAARDLELGTRLSADMVQAVDWPASVALKEPYTDPEKVIDRVVNAQVLRGEPIVAGRLAPAGEKGGLSSVLGEGKRAITVKVNEIVGVAGFALPGNYVDLMVNTPDRDNQPVSKIVLERILVLAVAQDLATNDTKARVVNAVTLEVTPQEAERIDLARSIGSLSLVLRSQVDKGTSTTQGARRDDLLKLEPAPAPAKAPTTTVRKPVAPVVRARAPVEVPVAPVKPVIAAEPVPVPDTVEVIRGMRKSVE